MYSFQFLVLIKKWWGFFPVNNAADDVVVVIGGVAGSGQADGIGHQDHSYDCYNHSEPIECV